MSWFTTERLDDDTFMISEYCHPEETHCYLLCGEERCLLIDTGMGVENIFKEISLLTDKPIIAVPTHVHWDHIGGLADFDEFCVHPIEAEWINRDFPLPVTAVRKMLAQGELPENFILDKYAIFRGKPSRLLNDRDKITLGCRTLEVLHTPGHSPGHMCFWEERRGYLFTGDIVYKGVLYANYPSTDPKAFLRSLKRLSELPIKRIFPAHHSTDISPVLLSEMINGLESIKRRGMLKHGGGRFDFGEWSIML